MPVTNANSNIFLDALLTLNNTADTEVLSDTIIDQNTQQTALRVEVQYPVRPLKDGGGGALVVDTPR